MKWAQTDAVHTASLYFGAGMRSFTASGEQVSSLSRGRHYLIAQGFLLETALRNGLGKEWSGPRILGTPRKTCSSTTHKRP